jgi:hypothetical protein
LDKAVCLISAGRLAKIILAAGGSLLQAHSHEVRRRQQYRISFAKDSRKNWSAGTLGNMIENFPRGPRDDLTITSGFRCGGGQRPRLGPCRNSVKTQGIFVLTWRKLAGKNIEGG